MSCPVCGGTWIGDGYLTVRHCENATEADYEFAEPDARPVVCRPTEMCLWEAPPEIIGRAIALLQEVLVQTRKAKWLQEQFYCLSAGTLLHYDGQSFRPSLKSPEVQLLLAADLVDYRSTWSTYPDVPPDSLRMVEWRQAKAEEAIKKYVERIPQTL